MQPNLEKFLVMFLGKATLKMLVINRKVSVVGTNTYSFLRAF